MKKISLIVKWIEYGADCLKSISKALDILSSSWPSMPSVVNSDTDGKDKPETDNKTQAEIFGN